MDDPVPRQVIGQGPPSRLLPLEGTHHRRGTPGGLGDRGRLIELGRALLQILQRERQLIELGAVLGRGAEPLLLELRDLELELLDLDLERDPGRLGERGVDLRGLARHLLDPHRPTGILDLVTSGLSLRGAPRLHSLVQTWVRCGPARASLFLLKPFDLKQMSRQSLVSVVGRRVSREKSP